MNTKTPIQILLVEDSEDDAILLLDELSRGQYEPLLSRVETEKLYLAELANKKWDVVISDYSLPNFSGLEALKILRGTDSQTPFILISGTVGEDVAVEAMKAGAQDYIMKTNFTRLVPALRRELAEVDRRKENRILLQKKEEELRQSQKMEAIGQLAGGLAHDFNNMLGVVGLLAETIDRFSQDEKKVKANAHQILETQERAKKLVRQLLFFGRKQESVLQVLDLNQAIRNLEPMLEVALGGQNQISFQLSPSPILIHFDPSHLEQVLLNLIVNAKDALGNKGQVTIQTLLDTEGFPCLLVKDNGCGMDEATRLRIFEPFFTTKALNEGSGLGLSTVFGIVTQHKGQIDVESQKGQGTMFRIRFSIFENLKEAK